MSPTKTTYAIIAIAIALTASLPVKAQIFDDGKKDTPKKETQKSDKTKTSKSHSSGSYGYKTAFGLRGGFTSGLTIKHFLNGNAAIEGIIGSRWRGFSIAALYELHKTPAFGVSQLAWEYGGGARMGFYDGYYYAWDHDGDPYYRNRNVTTFGVVGIFGLEYQFEGIPFTIGLDLLPYFDFVGRGDSFIDGSLSFRYVIK